MTSETERVPPILPTIAFGVLKDAERSYAQDMKFSEEALQALHATFGTVFVRAAELLENGRFIQYVTSNSSRKILKVVSRNEQYTILPDINFCHCPAFKYQVLNLKTITCKHVLAAKLAQICGDAKIEVITDAQVVDLLNDQLEHTEYDV